MIKLSFQDFFITQGTRGQILCNKVSGICLVMFYSPSCDYCKHFLPSFQNLSRSINGCRFAVLNVNQNKPIIGMSKNTIIPITYVPYIILYVEGKPFMRYDGPKDENEIKRFIMDVTSKFAIQNKFATNNKAPNSRIQVDKNTVIDGTNQNEIPAYTIGVPKTGGAKQVCYFNYEEAYGQSNKENGPSKGQKFATPNMTKSGNQTCYHCYDDAYGKK